LAQRFNRCPKWGRGPRLRQPNRDPATPRGSPQRTGLPPERTWLNDVAFGARGDAYFTDSTAPVLRRARRAGGGYRLQRFLDFSGTPVRYRTASGAAGINVNGIAASADGHDLVIAKRNDNALFHVDLRTQRVRRVALPAGAVTTPDGLVLRGRTLYVVQNTPSAVKLLRTTRPPPCAPRSPTRRSPSQPGPPSTATGYWW
jgi:sugar lactone lactonase YvrE